MPAAPLCTVRRWANALGAGLLLAVARCPPPAAAGIVKDAVSVSGTCGNGLECPTGGFHTVDCFQTLLSARCTYSLGGAFVAFIGSLVAVGCALLLCMLYLYCRAGRPPAPPQSPTEQSDSEGKRSLADRLRRCLPVGQRRHQRLYDDGGGAEAERPTRVQVERR